MFIYSVLCCVFFCRLRIRGQQQTGEMSWKKHWWVAPENRFWGKMPKWQHVMLGKIEPRKLWHQDNGFQLLCRQRGVKKVIQTGGRSIDWVGRPSFNTSYSSSMLPELHAFMMESQLSMSQSIFHSNELLLTVQWLDQHFAKCKRSGANEVCPYQ